MRIKSYRTFQALILAVLGFYLLDKLGGDSIQFYVNPRFILLVLLVTLLFFVLAQRILFNRPPDAAAEMKGSRLATAGLLLMILPVAADILYQALPYQNQVLTLSGINRAVPLPPGGKIPVFPASVKSDAYTILDWVWLFQKDPDPAIFNGETANATGMVYHAPGLAANNFFVVRFAITNSVADLQPVGMVVEWPVANNLVDGQWVQVQGEISAVTLAGRPIPKITAHSLDLAPAPGMPYIIP